MSGSSQPNFFDSSVLHHRLLISSAEEIFSKQVHPLQDIENNNDLLIKVKEGNGNWDSIYSVTLFFRANDMIGMGPDAWCAVFRILQQRLSPKFYDLNLYVWGDIATEKMESRGGVDKKILPLLPTYFPDIRHLQINTNGDNKSPQICKSIGKFQQLTHLRFGHDHDARSLSTCNLLNLFPHFVLSVECLWNLADSIEQLPSLRTFQMKKWIVGHDEDPEPGLEAFFCALWEHPTLRYKTGDINRIGFRFNTGDINFQGVMPGQKEYPISQECWDILRQGPSATQGLNQLIRRGLSQLRRQGRLPVGFPEDNQYRSGKTNLEVWAAAVITGMGYDKNDHIFDYLMGQLMEHNPQDFVAVAKIVQETINKATAAVLIQRQFRRFFFRRNLQKFRRKLKQLRPSIIEAARLVEEAEGLEKEAERLLKGAKRKRDEKENLLASIRGKLSRRGG